MSGTTFLVLAYAVDVDWLSIPALTYRYRENSEIVYLNNSEMFPVAGFEIVSYPAFYFNKNKTKNENPYSKIFSLLTSVGIKTIKF